MQKLFQCLTIMFFLAVLLNETAFSANEQFRSIASGNWNANATWEMSTNGGSTWIPATSTPRDTSGIISVRSPNTVTVTVSVTADQLTVQTGGTLSISSGINLTILNGSGDDFTLQTGGTVSGLGTLQTQGTVEINIRGGSNFGAALKINSGTAVVSEQSSPYNARIFGTVTVDAGATLNTNSGGYTLYIYKNLTNNGAITGSSGSGIKFFGPSLVNNGSIACPFLTLDSTSTLSGSGSYTGADIIVTAFGNISLLNNITFSLSSEFEINNGGIFSANTFTLTLTSGLFNIFSGGTVANSGLIRTQGSVSINPRNGSNFRANLNVNTGTTIVSELVSPYDARLFGNVTVDAGATLNTNSGGYTLFVYGSITNNGTISGTGANAVRLYGSSLVNNGSITSPILRFDSTSTVSGSGTYTGADIIIDGNVSLLNNVTFAITSELTIMAGGVFSANTFVLTFTSGTFEVLSGGTVLNSGVIRTQNTVILNLRTGSAFNAALRVISGVTTASEQSSPYNGRLFGTVTVDAGATLNTDNGGYTLWIYGALTNNGTITGTSSKIKFFGPSLVNNGSITSPEFRFDSTSTVSGSGTYTGLDIVIGGNGNVSLLNNVTFLPSSEFDINTGGSFSANGFIFTLGSGVMTIFTGATVVNSGTFRTQGTVAINPRTGSNFNANLLVNTGTTTASELSSPFNAKFYGNITVDAGATLSGNSGGFTIYCFGNIINNGSIIGSGSDVEFQSGAHTLQGTGLWTIEATIISGATLTLLSNHQMRSVDIRAGGTFNISNQILKLTATNPILQNGTFTNANSTVEYNGTVAQSISVTNITYHRLKINNALGTTLLNDVTVNDTLSVVLGDLDLSGEILTISPIGYLTETPGNTVKGTSGYVTTLRNINAPSSLNVGGLGAVLSTLSNLGTTEIRRGHTVQTGLNGGTSIARYFDITPVNNSDLDATLVFKYDDSELNGKPESALKLFSSTNTGLTWSLKGGAPNTVTNSILVSKLSSFSRWSADTSGVSMVLNVAIEGFYNTVTNRLNMRDTVRAYFRNTTSPFAIVDSAKAVIDSLTFQGSFNFPNAPSGTYYIMIKHRNSIETWSRAGGESYTVGNTLHYNFPLDSNKAYGNNQKFVGTKWTIFSGDVNQNGIINLTDILLVSNAASSFSSGYVVTDVNGDRVTNLTDIIFTSNNSNLFVTKKTP